jgi:predicted esterase
LSIARNIFRLLPGNIQKNLKVKLNARAVNQRELNADKKLTELALHLSANALSQSANTNEWEQRKTQLKAQLTFMLGIEHLTNVTLSKATLTGTIDREKYSIEKWLFEYSNGLYSTTNVYIPKNTSNAQPCVMYLCGHWPSLDGAKTGLQDRYLWYPENGFVLMVVDPLGYGEINGIHHGTCRLNKWDWLSKGYTPAGAEVWNAMRMMDWLQQRKEVDSGRIAVTGISGGGVMTQYVTAMDERVKVAAASCSTYTIGHQVSNNLINGQCDCTYYPNIYQADFPEVLALIAPRPFLILGGKKDDIFPPEGFRAAYSEVKKVYGLCPDGLSKVKLVESNEGHTDPPHFLEETRKWICKWLNHEIAPTSNYEYLTTDVASNSDLRVTSHYPKNATNTIIDHSWGITSEKDTTHKTPDSIDRRKNLLHDIRNQVFGWFPKKSPSFNYKKTVTSGGILGEWTNFTEFTISTETDVEVLAKLCIPNEVPDSLPLMVWVKDTSDNVYFPDVDEFFPFLRTHALLIINPRFSEKYLSPNDYTRIERSSAILGRSIASQQIWDVLQVIKWLREQKKYNFSNITIFGKDRMAIVSLYVALLDETITKVIMKTPPDTHLKEPAIPMILRYADIPEIAGLVAPLNISIIQDINNLLPEIRPYFSSMSCEGHLNVYSSITELQLN